MASSFGEVLSPSFTAVASPEIASPSFCSPTAAEGSDEVGEENVIKFKPHFLATA